MPHRIEYVPTWAPGPMSYWVHRHLDGGPWVSATAFEPPLPGAVPGRGVPRLLVDHRRVELVFTSLPELDHAVEVLSRRHLPSVEELVRGREAEWDWGRANQHWLARFPTELRPWRVRQRLLRVLRSAREPFAAALAGCVP